MLTHGVARLSRDRHAECCELPRKLCGILRNCPLVKCQQRKRRQLQLKTKRYHQGLGPTSAAGFQELCTLNGVM
jgi:hypothetical protein